MKKSFTLVELLIVLVIIAVLVTLAVPQYEKMVMNARDVEAKRNLDALANSVWRYYLETATFPPSGPTFTTLPSTLDIRISNPTKHFSYGYSNDSTYILLSANAIDSASRPVESVITYYILYLTTERFHAEYPSLPGQQMNNDWYKGFWHTIKKPEGIEWDVGGWP